MSKLFVSLRTRWASLRDHPRLPLVLSIFTGAGTAFLLLYALYRFEVPSKPFIYVSF